MTPRSISGSAPLRLRVPGLLDVVLVRDATQIAWLNDHPSVVRPLPASASWLHRVLDRRLRGDLGFAGGTLPVFRARDDRARAGVQAELAARFDALRGAPGPEREAVAAYVREASDDEQAIGVAVQHWCARLFGPSPRPSERTYRAGRLLAEWPSLPPWRIAWARASGKLTAAKRELTALTGVGTLHAAHGTSIGMENIARTVRAMCEAARDVELRTLDFDELLRRTLHAPPAVLRGCARELHAPFLDAPLTPRTIVVFQLARAFARSGDLDVAFLARSWSKCPAHVVIPEFLRAVWMAAVNEAHGAPEPARASTRQAARSWRSTARTDH